MMESVTVVNFLTFDGSEARAVKILENCHFHYIQSSNKETHMIPCNYMSMEFWRNEILS